MILDETAHTIQEHYGKCLKDITIERLVMGVFFTGVRLSNGRGGISYTPTSDIHGPRGVGSLYPSKKSFTFRGMHVIEVLNIFPDTPIFNTVKIVVLNALSESIMSSGSYRVIDSGDALDMIDMGAIRKVAMVGAIRPFLKKLKGMGGVKICVIERKKESLGSDEEGLYVPPEQAREVIPQCDTVVITGASIANGSIDELLSYTRPQSTVIVAGPTASFMPDALFKRNVDVVSGVWVTKPEKTLDMLGEGMSAIDLFGECVRKINIVNQAKRGGL